MTRHLVTRHAGARAWAAAAGLAVDRTVEHLEPAEVRPGDTVIGSLPVHLAAEVCARGAHYLHLVLDLPPERRGGELDAGEMRRLGARVEEFRVERVGPATDAYLASPFVIIEEDAR